MRIYIPTRGRADKVTADSTLSRMPMELRAKTVLVVHPTEVGQYKIAEDYGATILDIGEYDNIAQKRQRIGIFAEQQGEESFLMMDDDIDFLIRRGPDTWQLRACEDDEVIHLMYEIEFHLGIYAQVAVSGREGNNRLGIGDHLDLLSYNTRAMRITGYQTKLFNELHHARVPVMEDIDCTLQLLRQGYVNVLFGYWANGQRMTNAPGGCSIWRTHEVHNAAAEKLTKLHPGLVKTRQKHNKTDADGFGTRTEVTVQWKKAHNYGV